MNYSYWDDIEIPSKKNDMDEIMNSVQSVSDAAYITKGRPEKSSVESVVGNLT